MLQMSTCKHMQQQLCLLLCCAIAACSAGRAAARDVGGGGRLFDMLEAESNTAEAHTSALLLSKLQQPSMERTAADSGPATGGRTFDREAYATAMRHKHLRSGDAAEARYIAKQRGGSSGYTKDEPDDDEYERSYQRQQQPDSGYAPRRQQQQPPYEVPSSSSSSSSDGMPGSPRHDGGSESDYYQPDNDAVTICFQNANAAGGLVLNAVNRTAT